MANSSNGATTYNEKIMVRGDDERGSPVNFDRELSPAERPSIGERPSLMT